MATIRLADQRRDNALHPPVLIKGDSIIVALWFMDAPNFCITLMPCQSLPSAASVVSVTVHFFTLLKTRRKKYDTNNIFCMLSLVSYVVYLYDKNAITLQITFNYNTLLRFYHYFVSLPFFKS